MKNHCVNCGAPVDYKNNSCGYCGSPYNPYEVMNARRDAADMDHLTVDKLARLVECGIMTPNETRRLITRIDVNENIILGSFN